MNKLLIMFVILCAGCAEAGTPEEIQARRRRTFESRLKTEEYNGHRYIVWAFSRRGGICHDPDCPCMVKGELNE